VEFVVSTGTDVQTVFLTVNLARFSVEQPTALSVLPETGTDTGANRLWLGFAMVAIGLAIIAGRFRTVFRRVI
jgi:LPXTG-motif cell wall-anchored protein